MVRSFGLIARFVTTAFLAAALVAVPGPGASVAVGRSGCPSPSIERIIRDGRLTCYGSRTLTFRAYVQRLCTECGGISAFEITPRWLDPMFGSYALLGTGLRSASTSAFVPPRLGRCSGVANLKACPFRLYQGHSVIVRARFNDRVARTCRYKGESGAAARKDAIAACRAELVVLSVGPAAPQTDAVTDLADDPAREPASLPWVPMFMVALLFSARWFSPSRLPAEPRSRPDEPRAP